jgi:peptidoglycan/LPS O-acetylase OafA/YrhL
MERLGYRPALDGLRAVAVLAVLLCHTWDRLAPGGSVGVDVFFVLSGFLITALLLDEHGVSRAVDLRRFYARRALRLLPALAATVALSLVLAALFDPRLLPSTGRAAVAAALDVENWSGGDGGGGLLAHTWSLSIEEQFYLAWPIVLTALLALGGTRAAVWASALGAALVMVHRVTVVGPLSLPHELSVHWQTDTRADALLIGCTVALLGRRGAFARVPLWAVRGAAASGAVALVAVVVELGRPGALPWSTMDRWGYTVTALAGAAVIVALVARPVPTAVRVLSWRPLVALGRISYGVYLYHFPIVAGLLNPRLGEGPVTAVLGAATTLVVATVSYRCLERPLRRSGDHRRPRDQDRDAQNSSRTAALRAGSCTIHQWPSPWSSATVAPARRAALRAGPAARKGSSDGTITSPGAATLSKPGAHSRPTSTADR